jgi:thiol-disulfide isomerase/thioredoxin
VIILGQSLRGGESSQEIPDSATETTIAQTQESVETDAPTQVQPTSDNWYQEYSEATLAQATTEDGKTVIFFHAGWCPTCQAASKDFEANRSQIPSDVTILKADYDAETELKTKYGVVMQDTFIQVNANGEVVSTWNSGGEGIKSLLANVQ